MGWFSRGIDIESGVIDPEGFFRTGRRPQVGRPLAEIYALSDPDDPPSLWWLEVQEKLSRAARWGDDYFQIWAEILAFGVAGGEIGLSSALSCSTAKGWRWRASSTGRFSPTDARTMWVTTMRAGAWSGD